MDINDIPRGQLSTIILTSLLVGDKYGYEIISEVEEKTNGELIIKKPSLYSSLSRMENQDLVSSYWKDSDIGGRRHYYRLTDYGKKQVLQWQEDLISSQTKVSKILKEPSQQIKFEHTEKSDIKINSSPIDTSNDLNKESENKNTTNAQNDNSSVVENSNFSFQDNKPVKELTNESNKDIIAQQENLFGALNSNESKENKTASAQNTSKEENPLFLQYDLFNTNFISTPASAVEQKGAKYVFNVASFENQDTLQGLKPYENDKDFSKEEIPSSLEKSVEEPKNENINSNENDIIEENDILPNQMRMEDKIDKKSNIESITPNVQTGTFDIEAELNKFSNTHQSYADEICSKDTNSYVTFDYIQGKENSTSHLSNSFSDNIKNLNDNIKPKINFFSDSIFISDNEGDEDENEIYTDAENNADLSLKETNLNEDENEIINDNKIPGLITNENNTEEKSKKDDAVFITDELNEEEFKVKKIEPASFSHLPSSPVTPVSKTEQTSKSTSTETYYEDYNSLKRYFKQMNIGLKIYGEETPVIDKKTVEIKINKFKFFSYLLFFVLLSAEVLTSYFVLNNFNLISKNHMYYFIAYLVIGILPLVYFTYKFIKSPNKKIDKSLVNINPIWFKLCIIALGLAIVYSLNVLFGMTFANIKYYFSTTLLPACVLLNFVIVHIFKHIYKAKVK